MSEFNDEKAADNKSSDVITIPSGSGFTPAALDEARAAGNTWIFKGREIEKYVARGEASVATDIIDPSTGEKTGASLIHNFKWDKPDAHVIRENSFKTNLSRVGRRVEQKINTAHLATVNSTFYQGIVLNGQIVTFENSEKITTDVSRDEMIQHAKLYPESASEAIESWLDAAVVERLKKATDFSFLFKVDEIIEILWYLGDPDAPVAAGIFRFQSPTSEERAAHDASVQNVETKRTGDVSSTDIEENFRKKIQYGAKHLLSVEGIAVGEEGKDFDKGMKEEFITLFGPIWFGDIVDMMHSTFDFMKGRSRNS